MRFRTASRDNDMSWVAALYSLDQTHDNDTQEQIVFYDHGLNDRYENFDQLEMICPKFRSRRSSDSYDKEYIPVDISLN